MPVGILNRHSTSIARQADGGVASLHCYSAELERNADNPDIGGELFQLYILAFSIWKESSKELRSNIMY